MSSNQLPHCPWHPISWSHIDRSCPRCVCLTVIWNETKHNKIIDYSPDINFSTRQWFENQGIELEDCSPHLCLGSRKHIMKCCIGQADLKKMTSLLN